MSDKFFPKIKISDESVETIYSVLESKKNGGEPIILISSEDFTDEVVKVEHLLECAFVEESEDWVDLWLFEEITNVRKTEFQIVG